MRYIAAPVTAGSISLPTDFIIIPSSFPICAYAMVSLLPDKTLSSNNMRKKKNNNVVIY